MKNFDARVWTDKTHAQLRKTRQKIITEMEKLRVKIQDVKTKLEGEQINDDTVHHNISVCLNSAIIFGKDALKFVQDMQYNLDQAVGHYEQYKSNSKEQE